MGAINEIMSKNCVPHDFEDFLLQMFRNTFQLLQRLVREEPNTTSRLQLLDPRWAFRHTHTHTDRLLVRILGAVCQIIMYMQWYVVNEPQEII